MSALLTDLYELTMSAGYFAAGKVEQCGTFELSVRRLPRHRNYVLAAGLAQAVEYLLNLHFEPEEIEYLRGLPQLANAPPGFFEYLRQFRFTGDLFAVPEGTPLFAGEPMLTLRAPLIEAQIPETYLLSTLTFQSLIATKAARMTEAGGGREIVEFGTRRAHTPEAGVLGARAAFIGGCSGTSNTLAGYRFGIPVLGTAGHAWVMSFASEAEAFSRMQQLMGERTVHLIDTYDTLEGARKAIAVGGPFWGVRLDSGDFLGLSRQVRGMLDQAGFPDAKIMASGDLDEMKIRGLVRQDAPIDSFGVGTELATSGDAPSMGAIYKMVEIEGDGQKRFTAKHSQDKNSLPGAKQIFRYADHDLLARSGECSGGAQALQQPVILRGALVQALPNIAAARQRAGKMLAELPDSVRGVDPDTSFEVHHSEELKKLIRSTRA
ncbi:MAG: nicotinate phosphoribosyltransferase [Acidobacteriota bacterium]|nr:nicotinate phosphoribosyltransferase [Acidobacteriota bacterium]